MSERCPKCGCDKQLDVSEFLHGRDWGVLYYCGTIYWPSRDEVTTEGVACRQLVRAQERLAEAERVNSALDAALVSARRQLEQALAREAELRRVVEKLQHIWAWFCPTRRPNEPDEAYQRRYDKFHELGEALDAALSSVQAKPVCGVGGRDLQGGLHDNEGTQHRRRKTLGRIPPRG